MGTKAVFRNTTWTLPPVNFPTISSTRLDLWLRGHSEENRDSRRRGRDFLFHVLANYVHRPEELLRKTPKGKPYLVHGNVSFNLSHTQGFASVAVTRGDHNVGVDIENSRRTPRRGWRAVATRFFSSREVAQVTNSEDFLKMWVCKEAVVKATGDGIAGGWGGLEVDLQGDDPVVIATKGARPFTIRTFSSDGGEVVGAWAVQSASVDSVNYWKD